MLSSLLYFGGSWIKRMKAKRRLAAYVSTLSPEKQIWANALRAKLDKHPASGQRLLLDEVGRISNQLHRVTEAVEVSRSRILVCKQCNNSGWVPNIDALGNRVWTPLMNDALPCQCGALARKITAEKDIYGQDS